MLNYCLCPLRGREAVTIFVQLDVALPCNSNGVSWLFGESRSIY